MSRLAARTLEARAERAGLGLGAVTRTLVVGPAGYATISEAVAAARDGDTVLVRPGRYLESVTVEGKTMTIRGDGDRDLIIVDGPDLPAFHLVATNTTIDNFTITGGGGEEEHASLLIMGGNAHLDRLHVTAGRGVLFAERAAGLLTRSVVDEDGHGILVFDGACPRIEENEIWGNEVGLCIYGMGSGPLVRANRVHDVKGAGILVGNGACPRIEENEIWGNNGGVCIYGAGSDPVVHANRVHDGKNHGILVSDGAPAQGSRRTRSGATWGSGSASATRAATRSSAPTGSMMARTTASWSATAPAQGSRRARFSGTR